MLMLAEPKRCVLWFIYFVDRITVLSFIIVAYVWQMLGKGDVFVQTLCPIWYDLYNLKNLKNTHRGALLLVKLQASACNFTKSKTLSCAFFTFFRLYNWYQIALLVLFSLEKFAVDLFSTLVGTYFIKTQILINNQHINNLFYMILTGICF